MSYYVILCHIIYHITRNLYCWIKLIKNRCRFHPFLSILRRVFSQDLAFWPGEKLYSQYEEEPQIAANMLMIVMHISWFSDIFFIFFNSKSLWNCFYEVSHLCKARLQCVYPTGRHDVLHSSRTRSTWGKFRGRFNMIRILRNTLINCLAIYALLFIYKYII